MAERHLRCAVVLLVIDNDAACVSHVKLHLFSTLSSDAVSFVFFLQLPGGSRAVYEGEFLDGRREGMGVLTVEAPGISTLGL